MSIKQSIHNKTPKKVLGSYHLFWAWSAAKQYRHPSRRIFVIGITGTKGKTTTLELLNAILEAAGKRTALLSSLRIKIGESSVKNKTGNSMPGRGYVQRFLRDAVRAQCTYALVEVTSQGVVAHRHRFVQWNIGVLTNLAPEHIESHGSFENYRNAKLAFLKYVIERGGTVFLNRDDASFDFFADALGDAATISYSRADEGFKEYLPQASVVRSAAGSEVPHFILSDFNQENVASAIAVAKELGIGDAVIRDALLNFQAVPGRMNFVRVAGYTAVVDYAHTPDSLAAVYRTLREQLKTQNRHSDVVPAKAGIHAPKRLICVLGAAGGGRDVWKRPEFGKIAAEYCDEIFLTDEDPYDEDPEQILLEIKSGMPETPSSLLRSETPAGEAKLQTQIIPDRRDAIRAAVAVMHEGDIVVATGKGSEDWIHVAGGKKIPWDEKKFFEEALEEKKNSADSLGGN